MIEEMSREEKKTLQINRKSLPRKLMCKNSFREQQTPQISSLSTGSSLTHTLTSMQTKEKETPPKIFRSGVIHQFNFYATSMVPKPFFSLRKSRVCWFYVLEHNSCVCQKTEGKWSHGATQLILMQPVTVYFFFFFPEEGKICQKITSKVVKDNYPLPKCIFSCSDCEWIYNSEAGK